jgi:uncharacterized membrane protein YbhN (UPF0104 family)
MAAFRFSSSSYALLKSEGRGTLETSGAPRGGGGIAILAGVAAVITLASGLTVVATMFEGFLPVFIRNNLFTPSFTSVISSFCMLCLVISTILMIVSARLSLEAKTPG